MKKKLDKDHGFNIPSFHVNGMNAEGKGLAAIDFLELPRPTVKAIKLMDLFRKNLIRGLITIDFAYHFLISFQNIDPLDDFA